MKQFMRKTKRTAFVSCLLIAALLGVTSCNDKNTEFDDKGSAEALSLTTPSSTYMGDSIDCSFSIAGSGVSLNQSKLQVWFGDSLVSERMITTPETGDYSGKIFFPFMKDIPDGDVKVKLRVQNERFASDTLVNSVKVVRPLFDHLALTTADGQTYEMTPVAGAPYTYAYTGTFPDDFYATIMAPKYGDNGNEIVFGSVDGKITNGVTDPINFTSDIDGTQTVTFNTLTYAGSPFTPFAINGTDFQKIDDTHFKVEGNFTQGEDINITGLKQDYANYWINPAFFDKVAGTDGKTLRFRAATGNYRITCDKNLKYFKVEAMNAAMTDLADLEKGDDVIWCDGDGNIGQPSYSKNGINWSWADKEICLAPMGGGVHQLILKKGETINSANFKFFYTRKSGSLEFTADKISLVDGSTWFRVNPGPSDSGNIQGGSTPTVSGRYYIITVDMSEGITKTKMSVKEVASIPEVAP